MRFVARDLTPEFSKAGLGDQYGPELVVGIFDKNTAEFQGGFVGDNSSLCFAEQRIWDGGIREVTNPEWLKLSHLEQLGHLFRDLARPMMLKHFWCYPLGMTMPFSLWAGGKAMIVKGSFTGTREELIAEWTRVVTDFHIRDGRKLLGDAFIGGADAGLNEDDIALICRVNGSDRCVTGGPGYFQCEKEGITGRILLHAAKIIAEYSGMRWDDGLRLGIYGFGNVGKGIAQWLLRDEYVGPRIVAVSNKRAEREGGIQNFCTGFYPQALLRCVTEDHKYGISALLSDVYTTPYTPGEELYYDLDVLFLAVPLEGVINTKNAPEIKAKIVLSGTNSGITHQGYEILHQRGIMAPSDFVVNMGTASTAKSSWHGLSDSAAMALAVLAIEMNLRWLLDVSKQRKENPDSIARQEVYSRLVELSRHNE